MDKLLLFPGKTERGIFTHVLDTELDYLTKTASEYHPEIASYINSAKKIEGKTQILLTALGSGEIWGDNVNGDFFPESELCAPTDEWGYKSFMKYANVFKHHVNKDPNAAYGNVPLAVYNTKYRRVELIIMIDDAKAPDIKIKIDNGEYPDWSMGCRVPYDVCSICGNKARTRKDYCEHLKYYIGRIDPVSGKKAYAINIKPRFFDISMVLIGADKIARTLKKVANSSQREPVSSAYLAEKLSGVKVSELEKHIPVKDAPASQQSINTLVRAIPEIKAQEPAIPDKVLNTLGGMDLSKVFSTLSMLGILPKPQEFQRIVLVSVGKKSMADELDSKNLCFDPASREESPVHDRLVNVTPDNFSSEIFEKLRPFIEDRSYASPVLGRRITIMIKSANLKPAARIPRFIKISEEAERKPVGIVPLMLLIAGMYSALSRKAPEGVLSGIDKIIANHPGVAAALGASLPIVASTMFGDRQKGMFTPGMGPVNPDVNNVLARIEEKRQKPYLKVASMLTPTKRLFMGVPLIYMASGILQKQKEANPWEEEGRIKQFIRKNPDILGAALATDAMMSMGGGGLLNRLKKPLSKIASNNSWEDARDALAEYYPAIKIATVQDVLSGGFAWPLIMGSANLPARVVGALFDQAILEASKKILSKKQDLDTI